MSSWVSVARGDRILRSLPGRAARAFLQPAACRGGKFSAAEHRRPSAQGQAKVVGWSRVQRKQFTAVVVTDERKQTVRAREIGRMIERRLQPLLDASKRITNPSRQLKAVKKDVERVSVIVERLLDVRAV